jgi:hypothetical protein
VRAIRSLAVLLVLLAAACAGGGGDGAERGGGEAAPPTAGASPSPASAAAAPAEPASEPGSSGATAADAQASATFFMRRELNMAEPVAGRFKATGPDTGEVGVHPRAAGEGGQPTDGPVTVVSLRRQPAGWAIVGTRTANIEVTEPAPMDTVHSPVRVAGRASAFEGTVQVAVKHNRTGKDPILGRGVVTGSGTQELGPFSGEIRFGPAPGSAGWVVFTTSSEADGQVLEATMVPVRLS